jgi:hypothetical protein
MGFTIPHLTFTSMNQILMLLHRLFFVLTVACCTQPIHAQDHAWWAENVGWDGDSHWREYLVYAPRFLGPNALPIPPIAWGRPAEDHAITLSGHHHRAVGDRTWNPGITARYAAVPGRITFEACWVPIEYYRTSHEWKTERNVFHIFYEDRTAHGDFHLRTNVRLWEETPRRPGISLRVGYRLASSNKVGAARFTDAPGYHFALSAGKDLFPSSRIHWRGAVMAGLYVWQTNQPVHVQNDGILAGLGLRAGTDRWTAELVGRGYFGYLNTGDRPVAVSLQLERHWGGWSGFVRLQEGFGDLVYAQFSGGVTRRLEDQRSLNRKSEIGGRK